MNRLISQFSTVVRWNANVDFQTFNPSQLIGMVIFPLSTGHGWFLLWWFSNFQPNNSWYLWWFSNFQPSCRWFCCGDFLTFNQIIVVVVIFQLSSGHSWFLYGDFCFFNLCFNMLASPPFPLLLPFFHPFPLTLFFTSSFSLRPSFLTISLFQLLLFFPPSFRTFSQPFCLSPLFPLKSRLVWFFFKL